MALPCGAIALRQRGSRGHDLLDLQFAGPMFQAASRPLGIGDWVITACGAVAFRQRGSMRYDLLDFLVCRAVDQGACLLVHGVRSRSGPRKKRTNGGTLRCDSTSATGFNGSSTL